MATRRQRRIIKTAARRYGISPRILWGVYGTESGFGHNQGPSSAGAVGPFQFMPGTARGLHINPYNFKQAAFGAAKYLSEYKGRGLSGMLSAYNAGPAGAIQPGYVHTVLDQSKSWRPVKGGVHGGSQHPMVTGTTTTTTSSPSVGKVDVTSLLSSLARPAPVASSLPALPAFAARPVTAGAPVQADSSPQPKADLSSMLAAASSLQGASLPGVKSTTTVKGQVKGSGRPYKGGDGLQLPRGFTPTHQTAGLPGYPAKDIFAKPGTAVLAPVNGKIIKLSGRDPSAGAYEGQGGPFGWSVYIQGQNGRVYYLTHLGSRHVRIGERVRRGQRIGTVGNYPGGTPDHIHEGIH